ncbi:hypothetical protein OG369_37430 [Streptomyces sp. NBC_01221]|uniref:hypothetical protein n=1 Tax=Streptomyces sp. NBC_01221 TaxID=2903782 RepID=UPI002259E8A2|nr:hypothetical protein [Streptomyces sp. NBC_01221]MCX4791582.1 hypothetical protein [Streptomyces sp. NBC_01221]
MSQRTAWQLTGCLPLDAADAYRIDTVGLYLTRSGVLASWPAEDFLALLGACRRDLSELRGVFAELLTGCHRRRASSAPWRCSPPGSGTHTPPVSGHPWDTPRSLLDRRVEAA